MCGPNIVSLNKHVDILKTEKSCTLLSTTLSKKSYPGFKKHTNKIYCFRTSSNITKRLSETTYMKKDLNAAINLNSEFKQVET